MAEVTLQSENSTVDYDSIDWEKFSFEGELEARKFADQDNIKELKMLSDGIITKTKDKGAEAINKIETMKIEHNRLRKTCEMTDKEGIMLLNEWRKLKNEVDELKCRNAALEIGITEAQKEENQLKEEYVQHKVAYNKALEKYSKHFGLHVSSKNVSDDVYEAFIKFSSKLNLAPLRLVVNRKQKRIIEFDTGEILTKEEEQDIKQQFGDMNNVPGLLCKIKDCLFSKME